MTIVPSLITYPFTIPPRAGEALEVADGVLWARMPLPMRLDHVNIYAFDEGESWTVVDTGFNDAPTRAAWEALRAGPLGGKPISRVIVTHHHSDHIGCAGILQAEGAELLTSRTAWLYGRMLSLDVEDTRRPETIRFWRLGGMPEAMIETRSAQRPLNFSDVVAPMPLGFTRLSEGDLLRMGGRDWRVRISGGHAPDHVTLWQEGGPLVVGGDAILPSISANIGVYATEPEADPLTDWLEACESFTPFARDDQLVLPGHKLPFTGLPLRLRQMAENHHGALARLLRALDRPKSASQVFLPVFGRELGAEVHDLAMQEALAHLNYLYRRGQIRRDLSPEGVWLWKDLGL